MPRTQPRPSPPPRARPTHCARATTPPGTRPADARATTASGSCPAGARERSADQRGRDAGDRQRGASAIEFAILAPILILTLLAVFQFAFYYYAREITLAAAQSGARVARTTPDGDWQGAAGQSARDSASKVGRGMLDGGVEVRAGQDGDQRWVEVSGKVVKVIPFLNFHVSQRSRGPIECFRPDVGSGTACQGGGAP